MKKLTQDEFIAEHESDLDVIPEDTRAYIKTLVQLAYTTGEHYQINK
jgi:hypothetical protein